MESVYVLGTSVPVHVKGPSFQRMGTLLAFLMELG